MDAICSLIRTPIWTSRPTGRDSERSRSKEYISKIG